MAKDKHKNIKKQINNSNNKGSDETRDKIIVALKILAGILAILLITVFITKIANGDFKKQEKEVVYNEIMAGQIFNRPEENYYVVIYSYENDTDITSAISNLKNTRIYKVNLDDKINNSVIGEKNISNNIADLKINSATLLEIENKEIKENIEKSNIISYLNNLENEEKS